MFQRADAALLTIVIQRIPAAGLRKRLRGANARRTCAVHLFHRAILGEHDVVLFKRLRQRQPQHVIHLAVQKTGAIQFPENADDPARAVNIFHMVFLGAGRHFAQLRYFAGETVDIAHRKVDFRFLGRGQQMQDSVGGAAHRDVERHGVFKRRFARDIARQYAGVVLLVITFGERNDAFARIDEEIFTIGMGRQQRAVARLRQAQRLGQTVHGVGGEHAGAGAAGRAGGTFYLVALLVADMRVRPLNHRIDQIKFDYLVGKFGFTGFHRTAGDENHRNVQTQGGHQHPGGDFVAVGDTNHSVRTVGVHHILDRVGNKLAGRQ
ncbi:two component transcriptional regulator, winged helix family [Cronobacter universalis NCTC 9529]|nr:two component transcriptional regulator, winged helix family [Cronobacter universalis NCTC 9529]